MPTIEITVRCVGCRRTRIVDETQSDVPLCEHCFSPMVAERATATLDDKED